MNVVRAFLCGKGLAWGMWGFREAWPPRILPPQDGAKLLLACFVRSEDCQQDVPQGHEDPKSPKPSADKFKSNGMFPAGLKPAPLHPKLADHTPCEIRGFRL